MFLLLCKLYVISRVLYDMCYLLHAMCYLLCAICYTLINRTNYSGKGWKSEWNVERKL